MRRERIVGAVLVVSLPVCGSAFAQSHTPVSDPKGEYEAIAAQIPKGASAQATNEAPDPIAGVASRIAPTQVDLASAAVTTREKGTEFRATFLPARLFDTKYWDVLSESKITLLSDGSLTRIGYGVAYNPFALRSKRVAGIGAAVLAAKDCGATELEAWIAYDAAMKPREDAVTAADEAFAKVDHAWRLAVAADASSVAALRKDREIAADKLKDERDRYDAEEKKQRAVVASAVSKCHGEVGPAEWAKINSGLIPLVSLTVAVDLYPFGKGPDPADKTQTARLEPFGGVRADAGFTFKPVETASLELWGNFRRGRTSGDPKTTLATYAGGGLTVSVVAIPLKDYTKSPDYIQTGFIPGVVFGASGQYSKCWGREDCDKFRTESASITPFMDIRIKAALQFRISAPITRYTAVNDKGTDLAPTLTLASTIATL